MSFAFGVMGFFEALLKARIPSVKIHWPTAMVAAVIGFALCCLYNWLQTMGPHVRWITLGISERQAVEVQGRPFERHEIGNEPLRVELSYGRDYLEFWNDKLVSYGNGGRSLKLKPKVDGSPKFTMGSSLQEVFDAQGMPTDVETQDDNNEDGPPDVNLWYQPNEVQIRKGVVMGYDNSGEPALKVQLLPKVRSDSKVFDIGSSEDEVLSLQGTPTKVEMGTKKEAFDFAYGEDLVRFGGGRVVDYSNAHSTLKVKSRKLNQLTKEFIDIERDAEHSSAKFLSDDKNAKKDLNQR